METKSSSSMLKSINWDYLLESIEEEKCVICLGPGIFDTPAMPPLEQQLSAFLREHQEELRIRVYSDGWFHYLPDASEIDAWKKVKEFYGRPNAHSEAILDKIVQVPFHFFLTFTPDYKTREAFSRKGIPFSGDSYIKKTPFDSSTPRPTKQTPIVYNLLGELNKRNSLVMTYTDFYSYLESAFEGNSMAPVLKENIWDADYFVFLGIPFDKWYMHLFMRILQQHDKKRTSKKYAANPLYDDTIAVSCAEQYTMTFVHTDIVEFVDALYEQCESHGILRKAHTIQQIHLDIEGLRDLLVNDKFDQILDILENRRDLFGRDDSAFQKQILLMQAQVNELRQKVIIGSVSGDEERLVKARIRERIADLLSHLDRQFTNP
ncbi:MAG: SIR2 family protein [Lewinellaceae bacterium]|nr:SIR2 family protein [Lewinellaceae bacterium]